jgi:uncharacterized damage-inducible protein DinB
VNPHELLVEPFAYMPPARALEGLSADEAARRPPGSSHSIAEIVGHLTFWQEWFIQRCQGTAAPVVQRAAAGWPETSAKDWPDVHARFIDGLQRVAALGDPPSRLDAPIEPAIEFPPLARYTIRDAVVHVASHNAHHLGQVIVLRQLAGLWPPPSGSWTW